MIFSEIQENLRQSINLFENKLASIPTFSVYSHISGDTDNTAEITIIVSPKVQTPAKIKIKTKDIEKYMEVCTKKNNLPNPEDKMFRKIIDYFTQNGKEYEMPREKLLYLLKRQDAGLKLNKWITQNLLYAFANPDNPVACVIQNETETAFYTILSAFEMKEDGLLLMIEDKLNQIMQENFGGTEGIPVVEKPEKVPEEQETEEPAEKTEDSEDTLTQDPPEDSPKVADDLEEEQPEGEEPKPKEEKKKKVVQKMGLFGPRPTLAKDQSPEDNTDDHPKKEEVPKSQEPSLTAAEKQALARKRLAERRMKRQANK